MSSYFMNSLMQCYYNQTTPMYAAAAAAAAGRNIDVCCAAGVNDAAAGFSTSSSSFSRRHQHLGLGNHRSSRLPPGTASQSTCSSYSFLGVSNMSECRHSTPTSGVFADTTMQSPSFARCTSTRLSPLVPYEAKLEHDRRTDMTSHVYGDCRPQLYDDSSLVVGLNDRCDTYKVEKPSPPTTPKAELRQKDATEMWNSRAHYTNSSSEQDISTVETEDGKNGGQTLEKDNDLEPIDGHQDDIDDMVTDTALTRTPTTTTTASAQHHQQQQQPINDNSSCDVKQTQLGVVYPIYPWMTRVHSTHGKFLARVLTFKCR